MNLSQIKTAQRKWAAANDIPAPGSYVTELKHNLLQPLSPASSADFLSGSGGELKPGGKLRQPKLHALHSSAALVCNVFDYWRNIDSGKRVLREALHIPAPITEMRFEAQFPTGLPGQPPNLDVALFLGSGDVWAIESKFTEPFGSPKRPPYFKDKYFPKDTPIWTARGLLRCGQLARNIVRGVQTFRHLDAPQLLKHALGLNTRLGEKFTLVYLYVDSGGTESDQHRSEVATFSDEIGKDFALVSMSYGALLARMRAIAGPGHEAYFAYLTTRYPMATPA